MPGRGRALKASSVSRVCGPHHLRAIVDQSSPPPGVKAYVSGPAALVADEFSVGEGSHIKVTALTFGVIFVMLLIVYRSIVTALLTLVAVAIQGRWGTQATCRCQATNACG